MIIIIISGLSDDSIFAVVQFDANRNVCRRKFTTKKEKIGISEMPPQKNKQKKKKTKPVCCTRPPYFFKFYFILPYWFFPPRHELMSWWLFFISFWFLNFWFFSPLLILFGLRWWKKDLGARIYLWPPSSVVYVVYIGFSELLFQLRFTCSIRISLHRCNRFSFPGTFWDFYSFFLDRKYFDILFYFLKFWYSNISRVCNNQSPFLVFVISGDWPAASGRGNY